MQQLVLTALHVGDGAHVCSNEPSDMCLAESSSGTSSAHSSMACHVLFVLCVAFATIAVKQCAFVATPEPAERHGLCTTASMT